jgi:AsmA-like protein
MRRGSLWRRLALIMLASAAAFAAAFAPSAYRSFRFPDATQLIAGLRASEANTIVVTTPIALSAAPLIRLESGTLIAGPVVAGSKGALKVIAPVISLAVDEAADRRAEPPAAAQQMMQQILGPLAVQIGTSGFQDVTLEGASLILTWGHDQQLTVSEIDAHISSGAGGATTAHGSLVYHGKRLSFDLSGGRPWPQPAIAGEMTSGNAYAAAGDGAAGWPIKAHITSKLLDVTAEGSLDASRGLAFDGTMTLQTGNANGLAGWLGHGWNGQSGPAIRVSGPATWVSGALTFGKSRVTVNDQAGVGAIALSYREARPMLEATLAFPALDVSPYLVSPATSAPSVTGINLPWLGISTDYPALSAIDIDWRISIERLQWRGEPVGSCATSVSSRGGRLDVDFAELEIGAHRGTLRFMSGAANTPQVVVRANLRSADAGPILTRAFGAPILSGPVESEIDIVGKGATLASVMETATGQGRIVAADGRMLASLSALKNLMGKTVQEIAGVELRSVATSSAFGKLTASLEFESGAVFIKNLVVDSAGLVAHAHGQLSAPRPILDLAVEVAPAPAAATSHAVPSNSPFASMNPLLIWGPWDHPKFSTRGALP